MTPREQAMAKGNEIRFQRVDLRRRMHLGEVHITDVLADPPWYIGNLRVFDLLERAPTPGCRSATVYHHRRTRAWMRPLNLRAALANVNLFAEVDDLTPRARAWLVAELRRLYRLPMTAEDHAVLERRPFQREAIGA